MSLLPISIFRNRATTVPPIITPGDEYTVYQYIGNNSHILASGSYITYLIIAGGGGGGGGNLDGGAAGGGGAGGFIIKYLQYFSPGTYSITVGSKGIGSSAGLNGGNGGNSTFNSLTAIGGGGGGGILGSGYAGNGGSSGGGSTANLPGTATAGQGNIGGSGASYSGGGGGGFLGAGTNGDTSDGGEGGAGGAGLAGYSEGGGGGGLYLGGNYSGYYPTQTFTTNAGVGGYGVAPYGPYAATSATGYGCGGGGGPPDISYSGGNGSSGTVILQIYAGLAPTSVTLISISKTVAAVTWSRASSAGISILIYQSDSTPVTTSSTLLTTGITSPVTISGTAAYYYAAVVIARYVSDISASVAAPQ